MKVLHVAESFSAGTYDFINILSKELKNLNHTIIYGKRPDTPEIEKIKSDFPPDTRFIFWKNAVREINPTKDFLALKELVRILKENKDSDIIHLHSSKAGFLGRLAAFITGQNHKVIYTPHGASFLRKDLPKHKIFIFESLEKLAYKLGGTVVACSKSEAEEFKRRNIDAIYIYNGILLPEIKQKTSSGKKNTIIGTMGRVSFQKNPVMFNNIAKYFLNKKNVEFLWIGDGELKNHLTSSNIKITGWMNREKAIEKLSEIDIYLSTSLWEGLPLSVLQAMALKKPLILSSCTGNIDLIMQNNKNGYIFSSEREAIKLIELLIEDSEKIKTLGENSFKFFIQNFTAKTMGERYKNLYKKISNIRNCQRTEKN